MLNRVFAHLSGKRYTLDGVPGIFVVEQRDREVLKHIINAPSSSRPPNHDRSRWGDNGYRVLNDDMDTYTRAAFDLGFKDDNLRNGLPDPTDVQQYHGAIRKEQLRLARPEMRMHPRWKEFEGEAEEGQAYWLRFNSAPALQKHLNEWYEVSRLVESIFPEAGTPGVGNTGAARPNLVTFTA